MSEKNLDRKQRWRCKTVAFRMSPEENDMLDRFVSMSGLTKQDYLINRSLQRDIIVQGNPRTYKALKNQLCEVLLELKRLEAISHENDELLCIIAQINETIYGFGR